MTAVQLSIRFLLLGLGLSLFLTADLRVFPAVLLSLAILCPLSFILLSSRELERQYLPSKHSTESKYSILLQLSASFYLFALLVPGEFISKSFKLPYLEFFLIILASGLSISLLFSRLKLASRKAQEQLFIIAPLLFLTLLQFQISHVHDAFQYLALAHSVVTDLDLDLFNQLYLQNSLQIYNPAAENSLRYLGVPISQMLILPFGEVLRQLLLQIWLFIPNTSTGFANEFLSALLSLFFGCSSVLLCSRLLGRFFKTRTAIAAAMLSFLLSPLLFFSIYWPGWTHPLSSFLCLLMLLKVYPGESKEIRGSDWLQIAALLAFATIVRPTNFLFAFFPLYQAKNFGFFKDFQLKLLASLLFVFIVALQPFAWWLVSGDPLGGPYKEVGDHFHFLKPAIAEIFFSVRHHGLAVWTPLFFLLLLANLIPSRRLKSFLYPAAALFLAHSYVYSSWSVWWTGVGFSNRFFCPLFVLSAFSVARSFEVLNGKRLLSWGALVLCWLGIALNFFFIAAYRVGKIPYGITGPELQEQPMSLSDFLTLSFEPSLSSAEMLMGYWHNLSLFPALMKEIVQRPHFEIAATTLVLLTITLALFWKLRELSSFPQTKIFILVFLPILSLLSYGLIYFSAQNTEKGQRPCRVPVSSHLAQSGYSEQRLLSLCPKTVSQVTVLSSLDRSYNRMMSTELATIHLHSVNGSRFSFPIRSGIETDSTFNTLFGDPGRNQLRSLEGRNFRSSFFHNGLTRIIPSAGFISTYKLPLLTQLDSISIDYKQKQGGIIVRDVFLH